MNYQNKEDLKQVYLENLCLKRTAKVFGVSKKTILNWMNKHEIERVSKSVQKCIEKPIKMFHKRGGFTCLEVATSLGVSDVTVNSVLRKLGLKPFDDFHRGYRITASGHRAIRVTSHPFCDKSGYVREHRLIMEDHLGRYLTKNEVVHHKDGDKLNNNIDNLEVMTDSEHKSYHRSNLDSGRKKNS